MLRLRSVMKVCRTGYYLVLSAHPFSTKGVRQQAAHEMRVLRSVNEGEPSGGTASGSNVVAPSQAEEVDRKTQAGSSTRPQAQSSKGPKDSPLNTSEHFTFSCCPSDFGI
jgi:hypothetical protein